MVTKENSIAEFVKQQIRKWEKGPAENARKRVIARESRRSAFVRKSYNADISDPENYDLTIITGRKRIETAVEAVVAAVRSL